MIIIRSYSLVFKHVSSAFENIHQQFLFKCISAADLAFFYYQILIELDMFRQDSSNDPQAKFGPRSLFNQIFLGQNWTIFIQIDIFRPNLGHDLHSTRYFQAKFRSRSLSNQIFLGKIRVTIFIQLDIFRLDSGRHPYPTRYFQAKFGQSGEFAHRFSERIARFLQKK